MPVPQQVFVAAIGVGGVGQCFLSQLSQLSTRLSQHPTRPIQLCLILLARSNQLLLSESYRPLDLQQWRDQLQNSHIPALHLVEIADYLTTAPEGVILVDNTSSPAVAESYPIFLQRGISIVTPNKKAFSGDYDLWRDVFAAARNGSGEAGCGYVFHESSVGAGLPVISTLNELVETGDEVRKIEGVFSGTMSFLFNSFMPVGGGGGTFSAEVKKAKELGFTEPDPREDLNGLDVARKLTILARLAGLEVQSATSFPVQSLIPKELEEVSGADDFLKRLGEFDEDMEKRKSDAAAEGKVLRYVGSVDCKSKEIKVGLESFDASHPIAALKGSDNIISFYTERYGDRPLIIQGAGAGGEVTAMGVTGDLMKVVRLMH